MVDFKTLKKSSGDISRLTKAIDDLAKSEKSSFQKTEFWRPTPDKAGNAFVIFRFLPEPEVDGDDAVPFVRVYSHSFQGPTGQWYIENSLRTIGQKDPVGEYNSMKWKEGDEDTARAQKRKTEYFANIMILKNPNNPAEEGQVFPYKFGTKIFRKIEEANDPWHDEDGNEIPGTEGLKSVNVFDYWTGSDFRLRMKTVKSGSKKFPNYDDSTFVKDQEGQVVSSPLTFNDKVLTDKELEEIHKNLPSILKYIAPDQFKSYDELKAKLYKVIGEAPADEVATPRRDTGGTKKASQPVRKPPTIEDDESPFKDSTDYDIDSGSEAISTIDDDEDISFFQKLAEKDE